MKFKQYSDKIKIDQKYDKLNIRIGENFDSPVKLLNKN